MTADRSTETACPYADGFTHITAHLRVLDQRIAQLVRNLRQTELQRSGLDARNHILVSDGEVDRLLDEGFPGPDAPASAPDGVVETEIAARVAASAEGGIDLPFDRLCRVFGLCGFERDAVMICLAPEIDRRYDRLYAYLQDDATRKRPSVDLILRLLCGSPPSMWQAMPLLAPDSTLMRKGILEPVVDGYHPSGSTDVSRFLRLNDRITRFIHGHATVDDALADAVTVKRPVNCLREAVTESWFRTRLLILARRHFGAPRPLVLGLRDQAGADHSQLAADICAGLGRPLIVVDAAAWIGRGRDALTLLPLAFRECLLHQAAIYVGGIDELTCSDARLGTAVLTVMSRAAAEYSPLTFLSTEKSAMLPGVPDTLRYHAVEIPAPDTVVREAAWRATMRGSLPAADPSWAAQLARAFTLTPHQIAAAADEAALVADGRRGTPPLGLEDLFAACREQGGHQLGDLALKTAPSRTWDDLILPAPQLGQLHELCAQVRHRTLVLEEWGFGRIMSRRRGVSVLFTGVPGTGKTMAAEVVAGELGVDLFTVDLSAVVSKYIGETEKNLATVFRAAESSNAILFFDEADALFGKRTEVADAHDRYANIETSYLLQKMEQHDGVVILATNLRENMDEAFARRLRLVIEFPFPDEVSRALIWRAHLPPEARISPEVDLGMLASLYPLSGAGIRNAVLTAAFAAAEDVRDIELRHVRHGVRREYEKLGKLWDEPLPQYRLVRGGH
ncbi:ATP-binding protein [Nonomuraea sp. NPDC050556]|uniref:ATP-binding protein n=1 Tax=Nonomuraea sp. NPDC050556 TaxID=3364369 RepID=UPI0037910EFD